MNSCSESRTSGEPAEMPIAWKLSLAAVVAVAFATASILVLFPLRNGPLAVVASNLGLTKVAHHFPEGQLQADAKTLVAELKWIFLPDSTPAALASTNNPLGAPEVSQLSGSHLPASQCPSDTVASGGLMLAAPPNGSVGPHRET